MRVLGGYTVLVLGQKSISARARVLIPWSILTVRPFAFSRRKPAHIASSCGLQTPSLYRYWARGALHALPLGPALTAGRLQNVARQVHFDMWLSPLPRPPPPPERSWKPRLKLTFRLLQITSLCACRQLAELMCFAMLSEVCVVKRTGHRC